MPGLLRRGVVDEDAVDEDAVDEDAVLDDFQEVDHLSERIGRARAMLEET